MHVGYIFHVVGRRTKNRFFLEQFQSQILRTYHPTMDLRDGKSEGLRVEFSAVTNEWISIVIDTSILLWTLEMEKVRAWREFSAVTDRWMNFNWYWQQMCFRVSILRTYHPTMDLRDGKSEGLHVEFSAVTNEWISIVLTPASYYGP